MSFFKHERTQHSRVCRIATCNLLNLALPNRVFYDNAQPYSNTEYKQKINGLADLLTRAQSDVYAVQEVWDERALRDLADKADMPDANVVVPFASNDTASELTSGSGAKNTPAQGIISRFSIINAYNLIDFKTAAVMNIPDLGEYKAFNRPPLVAMLDVFGHHVMVISAHLKSKRPYYRRDDQGDLLEDMDDPNVRVRAKLRSLCMRAAEATAIRLFIIEHLKNTREPLILLGDMNDVTNSVTTQLMAETSEVNYDKRMRDTALFNAMQVQTGTAGLNNMAYTHLYQGMPEVIDHLFVSEEFVSQSKFAIGQVVQVDYFNDHLKTSYAKRPTDHGLVRATLRFNDTDN